MSKKIVQLYSTVTLKNDQRQITCIIVKPEEINIFENKISSHSPLGRAILNHQVNDVVKVETPIGIIRYKIVAIR